MPPVRPVTLRDIARRLGLSVTTVSRALAGYSDVAPDTRARVQQAARDMGYRPHAWARRLRRQRTDTLGFIIPTHGPRFADPFFSELLAGIGNEAARHEYDLLVSTRGPGADELAAYERMVAERRVDGFLLVRTRRDDARVRFLLARGVPFVAFGRTQVPGDFPWVDVDGEAGLYALTRMCIRAGHRRIGFINAPDTLMYAQHRLVGYRRALAEANIPFDPALVHTGDLTEQGGYAAAQALLALRPRPTALLAANDLMALGVLTAVREAGLQVGREVAVAGFDDIPLAAHAQPPLTTVHQPIYDIGRRITAMLIARLQNPHAAPAHLLLTPRVVVRASCPAPAGASSSDPAAASRRTVTPVSASIPLEGGKP